MERVYSPRKEEQFINGHEIPNSSYEEEPPLFLGFPSPFFDDITIPILTNNHTTHQHHRSSPKKPLNITEPSPSELKQRKKASVGKKDRHSKIHTAKGLRDRRMRLSLDIARKFFELQDLLGFDRASKTIEWLFRKSNKAIKEVAENFNPQQSNQSMSEGFEWMDSENVDSEVFLGEGSQKQENTKKEVKKNREPRKRIQRQSSARETRVQARARARERTRERLMIKELEKSKFMFEGNNHKDEIYKLGLGYLESLDNHNIEDIGYTSSPSEPTQQDSSSPSLEHSSTHHLLRELQSANNSVYSFGNFSGSILGSSALINHNPPADWQNSSNGFLEFSGGWDIADNFIADFCNNQIVPSTAPLTGDIYEQNPSSFSMSTTTNFLHFQSQNQGKLRPRFDESVTKL